MATAGYASCLGTAVRAYWLYGYGNPRQPYYATIHWGSGQGYGLLERQIIKSYYGMYVAWRNAASECAMSQCHCLINRIILILSIYKSNLPLKIC